MMAASSINIVPLAGGLLHSGGQQTFLNSMWMGKPTIVTDPGGACDYIEDGVDGILVEPGDVRGLREALLRLTSNPAAAAEMGARARQKVLSGYSTEDHFRRIISLAHELVSARA
jgi:glycosyltransferase involved in cell wall biosynthesis